VIARRHGLVRIGPTPDFFEGLLLGSGDMTCALPCVPMPWASTLAGTTFEVIERESALEVRTKPGLSYTLRTAQ
jgi:hypothetical protein